MKTMDCDLDAAAKAGMLVTVDCKLCHHSGFFLAEDLARFQKSGQSMKQIRFRCSQCCSAEITMTASELDRDRLPDIVIWRPTRLR